MISFRVVFIRAAAVVALVAGVVASYSLFANLHLHVLPDGRAVVHSHPHENDGDDGGAPGHSHSNRELRFILLHNQTGVAVLTVALHAALGAVLVVCLVIARERGQLGGPHYCRGIERSPPLLLSV